MEEQNRHGAGDHRTLLIVDDDEFNRAILDNLFAPYYPIQEAENGHRGLEAILAGPEDFSAVLLDVVMPEMDGLQVLHKLSEQGLLQKLPVFLITAEARDEVMREAYRLGVMDVISKPVVPYVVLRRVQSVVELFEARRRLSNTVEIQQSELMRRARQIAELNMGMLEALSTAIEFRDGESGEHVRRIHHITKMLLTDTPPGSGHQPCRDRAHRHRLHHARCGQDRHSGRHPEQARQTHPRRI